MHDPNLLARHWDAIAAMVGDRPERVEQGRKDALNGRLMQFRDAFYIEGYLAGIQALPVDAGNKVIYPLRCNKYK